MKVSIKVPKKLVGRFHQGIKAASLLLEFATSTIKATIGKPDKTSIADENDSSPSFFALISPPFDDCFFFKSSLQSDVTISF